MHPMSIVIACPRCAKRYDIADSVQGKRVRCQQCGNVFTAEATPDPSSAAPSLPASSPPKPRPLVPAAMPQSLDLLATDLSQLPAMPSSPALSSGANPLGGVAGARSDLPPAFGTSQQGISNPSGGRTDMQMRLVCGGMLALGVVVSAGSLALEAAQGTVYLGIVILLPLMFVLG